MRVALRSGGRGGGGWSSCLVGCLRQGILGGSTCKEQTARAGHRPPGHDRCSFGSRRCAPASITLAPKGGAEARLDRARITGVADASWRATALCPQDTGGHVHSALVLPGIAHHLQPELEEVVGRCVPRPSTSTPFRARCAPAKTPKPCTTGCFTTDTAASMPYIPSRVPIHTLTSSPRIVL